MRRSGRRQSLRAFAALAALAIALVVGVACTHTPVPAHRESYVARVDAADDADGNALYDASPGDGDVTTIAVDAASAEPDTLVAISDDPSLIHRETREALLELIEDPRDAENQRAMARFPFGPGIRQISQGNKAAAHHAIGRRTCLEGLKGIVLQTPEQRARCGAENMVPVYGKDAHGDPALAKFCIDVFEFPNKACELPLVWMSPTQAAEICKAEGKRLCDQDEWALSCRADPAGGKDRVYAYGDELDQHMCNTNKSRLGRKVQCGFTSMTEIWNTCTTDTEPAGAYPRCRSRFGVFDQHGNVAEIMTRYDFDGHTYSQLRGSAFHYVDVAKKHTDPGGYFLRYPDHCNFEPRWHVERIEQAHHTNYHLGFRCCKTIARDREDDAGADAGGATDARTPSSP